MVAFGNPLDAGSATAVASASRRIVIFNWRDIRHPRAGGAEKVTHEIARRWVQWGHSVTLFCSQYPGAVAEESIDGVRVVRRGDQHTVHWEAYRYYPRLLRGNCDVILDEVNTIPFFAPLYAREPVIMFSHQLAREVWHYEAPFPVSALGYLAEPLYLQAYRRTPILTVSQSTHDDLRSWGLRGPSYIIPEAVDARPSEVLPGLDTKEPNLTLAFVGRVVPSKRVDHIVRALALIHRAGVTDAQLWIIGAWQDGYRRRLEDDLRALRLGRRVIFHGQVDEGTKEALLARAHVLVMTSVREGWGLAVTEANVLGTPAVVYDVPGLRDSTKRGETGLICSRNTPAGLAQNILSLHATPSRYAALRERAWSVARHFSWDRTAREAWQFIERICAAHEGRLGADGGADLSMQLPAGTS
jgi:glycosyltransferase involved in cell wall biosynthesis